MTPPAAGSARSTTRPGRGSASSPSSSADKPAGRAAGRTGRTGKAADKPAKAADKPARIAGRAAKGAGRPEESRLALVRRARRINRILAETYPDAHCELDFADAFQLLVATILSAQTTDKRVNLVTPTLFAKYPTAADLAAADPEDVESIIQSTGFFRAKTKSIMGMAQALVERYSGEVPGKLKDLVTLPGVGRKTANVVLGNAFGVPGITVDTHVQRLSRRFGWTTETDPVKIEHEIGALIEKREWTDMSQRLIWHGRRRCHSRRPACGACPVAPLCPSFGEGPTDAKTASKLVRSAAEALDTQ